MLNALLIACGTGLYVEAEVGIRDELVTGVQTCALPIFAAFTGALPVNVPPAGLLSMAIATAPVKLVTVFPDASRAVTVTAGVIATPTCVVVGCTPNPRCVAGGGGAAVMLNGLLVA